MEEVDLVLFIRGLIAEAAKLTDSAEADNHSQFLIHMTAAQVCASIAQALLKAKSGDAA